MKAGRTEAVYASLQALSACRVVSLERDSRSFAVAADLHADAYFAYSSSGKVGKVVRRGK
jgi:hypothetical protein